MEAASNSFPMCVCVSSPSFSPRRVNKNRRVFFPAAGNGRGKDGAVAVTAAAEERRRLVEVMEGLEREAIMGEDEGREAADYNRRAQIFERSSNLFMEDLNQEEDEDEEETNPKPTPKPKDEKDLN